MIIFHFIIGLLVSEENPCPHDYIETGVLRAVERSPKTREGTPFLPQGAASLESCSKTCMPVPHYMASDPSCVTFTWVGQSHLTSACLALAVCKREVAVAPSPSPAGAGLGSN